MMERIPVERGVAEIGSGGRPRGPGSDYLRSVGASSLTQKMLSSCLLHKRNRKNIKRETNEKYLNGKSARGSFGSQRQITHLKIEAVDAQYSSAI